MSPTSSEIERAQGIMDAIDLAQSRGLATARLNGRMIDQASRRHAAILLEKAALVAATESLR